jgi:16S rRNA processing protein RimM
MKNKIYIAKIGKTVGLKGQLKLHIDSDFPEQFSANYTFVTNKNISLIIESFNKNNNVVKFVNFDTIEDAHKLVNQQLFSTLEDTRNSCKLDKNQYFWFDLINSKISENDNILGKVIDIHRYPQGDYFEIKTSNNKIFLLPYTKQYILNVDIKNKVIEVQGATDILEAS